MDFTPKAVFPVTTIVGEGPVWHEGAIWFLDLERGLLFRGDPANGETESHAAGQRIGCMVPSRSGDWIGGLQTGLARWNPVSGKAPVIIQGTEISEPDMRFNDGKCDPGGRLYAGTMSTKLTKGAGTLYRADATGRIRPVVENVTISNGLAWDEKRGRMYFIDTATRRVDVFDWDRSTGIIANRRTAVVIPDGQGWPDGMAIDAEGKLWVALWAGGGVVRCDPDTGGIMDKVVLPTDIASSCCFGGDDYSTLYITTATIELTEEQMQSQPLAGHVFAVQTKTRGMPSVLFAD